MLAHSTVAVTRRALGVLVAAVLVLGVTLAAPASSRAQLLIGAQMHPTWSDSGQAIIDQEFRLLQGAGANSVRIDLLWQLLEWNGKGQFDPSLLASLDWIFADAAAHGLRVVLTFWESPCWASTAPPDVSQGCSYNWWNRGVGSYPPKNPGDFADAAAFVARRWGTELAALEIWNEPNGGWAFRSATPAADYLALLKAAYPAVKAVAPTLPVLLTLGGTDTTFLGYLYALGARGNYDGIAVHPYSDPQLAGLQAFRAYETGHGDHSPLWVTEIGWPSNAGGEQAQASQLSSALRQLSGMPYIDAVEFYNLRDKGTDPSSYEDNFGLLKRDLTPKLAWAALTQMLAQSTPQSSPAPQSSPSPSSPSPQSLPSAQATSPRPLAQPPTAERSRKSGAHSAPAPKRNKRRRPPRLRASAACPSGSSRRPGSAQARCRQR
jgi:hypothetical protein